MWRHVSDDVGRRLALAAPPRRVVSLVPSLTELVCTLGRTDRLVGVTRYCTEPADVVAGLPKLGGTKNPDVEAIVSLAPDLVLANAEETRREDFQALTAADLIVFVSFPRSLVATLGSIERLGEAIDAAAPAATMAKEIASALADPPDRRLRTFCPIWRKPWMAFNRDTYADDLLRHAGADNVCADRPERYPVVDLNVVAEADPEVVLLPDEPFPFAERHRASMTALAGTTAWRQGRVHFVDGKALSWYGHRTAPALRDFRRLIAAS
jgi:ABC-type Fe3+-hydroxamate transport system substrate-binding protein